MLLKVDGLSFVYENSNNKILDNINLEVYSGDFILLTGVSGSGKTTLLKHLKKELVPFGRINGNVYFQNEDLFKMSLRDSTTNIGYLMQNPEAQMVCDKVWQELAFGLENLGVEPKIIKRRVAEIVNYFNLQDIFKSDCNSLSGGQKQLVNLAAILLIKPKLLLLDEPTSQLDPIAANNFIANLKKINQDLGITIIMIEHRFDKALEVANRVVILEKASIIHDDQSEVVLKDLFKIKSNLAKALPLSIKLANYFKKDNIMLDLRQANLLLKKELDSYVKYDVISYENTELLSEVLVVSNIYFRYKNNDKDIIKSLSFKLYQKELLCLIGSNGSGKSSFLKVLAKIYPIYRGKIKYAKNISVAYLPQNPSLLFEQDLVSHEFTNLKKEFSIEQSLIDEYLKLFDLEDLLDSHPYDLSGGQQQKVALIKTLLKKPDILLLDEPTKSLDYEAKKKLAKLLKEIIDLDISIILVSHDLEFCAMYATRIGMMFDGQIIGLSDPHEFFSSNYYYTSDAIKVSRNIFNNTINYQEVIELIKLNKKGLE